MRRLILAAAAIGALVSSVPARSEAGDLLVKARATYHHRSEGFSFTLNDQAQVVDASVDDAVGGEASAALFLTDHLAIEFSLGGVTYDLDDDTGNGVLSAGLLMSTATVQYHPLGDRAVVRPYIGAGMSYMNFYGEELQDVIINEASNPFSAYTSGIRGGFAPVGQVGADIAINQRMYVNIDAKYTSLKTEVYVQNETRQTVARRMGSLVVASGVGFRF